MGSMMRVTNRRPSRIVLIGLIILLGLSLGIALSVITAALS